MNVAEIKIGYHSGRPISPAVWRNRLRSWYRRVQQSPQCVEVCPYLFTGNEMLIILGQVVERCLVQAFLASGEGGYLSIGGT